MYVELVLSQIELLSPKFNWKNWHKLQLWNPAHKPIILDTFHFSQYALIESRNFICIIFDGKMRKLILRTYCGRMRNSLSLKKSRQVNYLVSNFFNKTIAFTKFLQQIGKKNFL